VADTAVATPTAPAPAPSAPTTASVPSPATSGSASSTINASDVGGQAANYLSMIANASTAPASVAPSPTATTTPAPGTNVIPPAAAEPAKADAIAQAIDALATPKETPTAEPAAATSVTTEDEVDEEGGYGDLTDIEKAALDSNPRLRKAWFRNRALDETGVRVRDARVYKDANMTPDRARELNELFPTQQSALRTVDLANAAQNLYEDFRTNPRQLLTNLSQLDPQSFQVLAQQFDADRALILGEDVIRSERANVLSDGMWRVLDDVETNAQALGDNEEGQILQAAVAVIRNELYKGKTPNGQTDLPPSVKNELNQLRQEREYFNRQQMAQRTQAQTGFQNSVLNTAFDNVRGSLKTEISALVPQLKDKPEVLERLANQAFQGVYGDVTAKQNVWVKDFTRMIQNGQMSKENHDYLVSLAVDQAKAYVKKRAIEAVEPILSTAGSIQKGRETARAAAPAPRDIAVAGASSVANPPKAVDTSKFKPAYSPEAMLAQLQERLAAGSR